jgi:hypothetical protein
LERAGRLRRLADALVVEVTARLAQTAGTRETCETVARVTGTTPGMAKELVHLAGRLAGLGPTRDALRQGRLSVRQAAVIAETTTAIHDAGVDPGPEEARLVHTATTQGLGVLCRDATRTRAVIEDPTTRARRQRAARMLQCWTDLDGMVTGRFRLPPEVGAQVRAVLEDRTRRIYRAQTPTARDPIDACAADALVALVQAGAATTTTDTKPAAPPQDTTDNTPDSMTAGTPDGGTESRPGPGVAPGIRPVVHIVVDHAALVRGATSDGERCEIPGVGPVDPGWVRQLLGDAFLTLMIRKGRDIRTVTHLGRRVPAELHSALVASGRECDVEGCARASYLELDHCEIDHAHGGPTSYHNLTWLCHHHHQQKTRGQARLGPPDPQTGKRPLHPTPSHDPPERIGSP